jgi:hypothetical protein
MSQITQSTESSVSRKIDQLSELASSIKDLEETKEDINSQRRDREQKNQAFTEVHEAIAEAERAFNSLSRVAELADVLEASVPRQDIEQTLDKYRPRIREFEEKSYDDFSELGDISSTRKEFEEFKSELKGLKETVKNQITSVAGNELDDVKTKATILRIPDVGTDDDAEAVNEYKQKIESIKRGQTIDAADFQKAKQRYSEVDIDIQTIRSKYGLSEDAGSLLLRFLRNETVTLADIDDGVLDELKNLEEFSERLTIQF